MIEVNCGRVYLGKASPIKDDSNVYTKDNLVAGNGVTFTTEGDITSINASSSSSSAPTLTWYTGNTGNNVSIPDTSSANLVKVYKNGVLLQPSDGTIETTLTWLQGGSRSEYADINGDSGNNAANTFEYVTRYTTPASEEQATNPVLIGARAAQYDTYTPVLWFNESHYLGLLSSYSTSSQAWNIILAADNKLDFNTTYDIRAYFDGSKYTIAYKKVSDSAWTSKSVSDSTSAHFMYMPRVLSGAVGSAYAQGKICLTKTKIKKNGVVLFDGLTATEANSESTSSTFQNTYYNNGCTVTTTTEQQTGEIHDYSISGTTLTLTTALTSSDKIALEVF